MEFVEPNEEEYLPGAASFVYQLDKRVIIIMRDGRQFVGVLRSFDQFMNLMLDDTCERVFLAGLFIIRGENVVLIGEIDIEKEKEMKRVPPEELLELAKDEKTSLIWDFDM